MKKQKPILIAAGLLAISVAGCAQTADSVCDRPDLYASCGVAPRFGGRWATAGDANAAAPIYSPPPPTAPYAPSGGVGPPIPVPLPSFGGSQ